jgi:hypothetical protein
MHAVDYRYRYRQVDSQAGKQTQRHKGRDRVKEGERGGGGGTQARRRTYLGGDDEGLVLRRQQAAPGEAAARATALAGWQLVHQRGQRRGDRCHTRRTRPRYWGAVGSHTGGSHWQMAGTAPQ